MSDTLPSALPTQGGEVLLHERASAALDVGGGAHAAHDHAWPHELAAPTASLELAALQGWFMAVSTFPGELLEAIAHAPGALPVRAVVRGDERMPAAARLSIYHHGYFARLVECLADDYPALADRVGAAEFEAIARGYVARHPSTGPNLNHYGRGFSEYVRAEAASTPALDEARAFLAELAALEWALVEALHAAPPTPLDAAVLGAMTEDDWGRARLGKSDSVRLLRFTYDVGTYYQAFREGAAPRAPVPGESALLVYRHANRLWRMGLTPAMAKLLDGLFAGQPLSVAMEAIAATVHDEEALADAERNLGAWFSDWMSSGVFSSIELPT
jgi:hypothetical protein